MRHSPGGDKVGTVDTATFDYYRSHSREIRARYENPDLQENTLLPHVFSSGQQVLDIGCGTGRDMALLRHLGVEIYGVEPVQELRELAIAHHPELHGRIFDGSLPGPLAELPADSFDGIMLQAVLMHIPDNELFNSAFTVRGLLRENGTLLVSVPTQRDDMAQARTDPTADPAGVPGETRDRYGRLMVLRPEGRIRLLFERLGFETESRYESADQLGRRGIRWVSLVFRLRRGTVSKSVDRIESIINQDRKITTYKLALLRALCDIAQMETHTAVWDSSGHVHVTMDSIARKWIEYYWPIIESPIFIPQTRGEYPAYAKPIAFRAGLEQLISRYCPLGGLQQFSRDQDEQRITEDALSLYRSTLSMVKKAIRQPVHYSGGGDNPDKPFSYDVHRKTVVLDGELWRELLLLGHFIRDSLILRWAELTAHISVQTSGPSISISSMIELLLTETRRERNVADARSVYTRQPSLECVWTGKSLAAAFDVDHIIPFSLRHDNSLWNLMPAHPRANNAKRDRLPSSSLISRRRDPIIHYWSLLYRELPNRFTADYRRLTGVEKVEKTNWQYTLLHIFQEIIEATAVTRGSLRWDGPGTS